MDLAQASNINQVEVVHVAPLSDVKLIKSVVVKFPKRAPSVVIPPRKIVYITADKTTCAGCTCFPKESPYIKPPKLKSCQQSPLTLYELAADVLDSLPLPQAFTWSKSDVVKWMEEVVGLPQYKECILDNDVNGLRLIWLENPSVLHMINIHILDHVKMIISQVRKLYSMEFIKFSRSIGLPPRKPLTHCTWFKSRTGPSWGIRLNWKRSDILRWMKIIGPKPAQRDHWELVWYQKPDFPKTLFAKIPKAAPREKLPQYGAPVEPSNEYLVPRKFRIDRSHPEEVQLIWLGHKPGSPFIADILKPNIPKRHDGAKETSRSNLMPKPVSLKGLVGKDLLLARRRMPKAKFLK